MRLRGTVATIVEQDRDDQAVTPRPPAIFVGRARELERVVAAGEQVRLGLVYGVGGIGKTALLLRIAEEMASRFAARVIYHPCRAGESLATVGEVVHRELGRDAPRGSATRALVALCRDAPLVLCLDDLHRAGETGLVDAMVHLARVRAPLWLCAASRTDLAIDPAVVDHVAIRLAGLSAEDSALLWSQLEQLYGPARRPRESDRAATPLAIKQAFASPVTGSVADPMGLATLSPPCAAMIGRVAAFRGPVPAALLAGDPEALAMLERRFLVERAPSGAYVVHDLVREEVLRSPLAPGREIHARCLAIVDADPAWPDRAREILFHAVASGDRARAEQILLGHASLAVRALPPGTVMERDLADAIDRLAPHGELPISIRLLRERLRARQGHALAAYRAIGELATTGDALAIFDHAEIALTIGRTGEALVALEQVATSTALGPLGQLWASVLFALAHIGRGAIDDARRALDRVAPLYQATGALGRVVRRACDVVIESDREHYRDACRAIEDVRREAGPTAPLGFPLMASVDRLAEVCLGGAPVGEASDDDLFDETLLFRIAARLLRAQELMMRGRMRAAIEMLEPTVASAVDASYGPLAWWGAWQLADSKATTGDPRRAIATLSSHLDAARSGRWMRAAVKLEMVMARAMLAAGELAEAREVALAALDAAHDLPTTNARLRAVALLADAAEGHDHRVAAPADLEGHALEEWRLACAEADLWAGRLGDARRATAETAVIAERVGWRYLACRARVLLAEARHRLADPTGAQVVLAVALRDARAEGYAVEHARALLVAAACARMTGDEAAARSHLELAATHARDHGLGSEAGAAALALGDRHGDAVAKRLADRLGLVAPIVARLRDGTADYQLTAAQLDAVDIAAYAWSFDLHRRRARIGSRTIDLGRNAALVAFLGVLTRRPGEIATGEEIARALWEVEYHPLKHHSRLTVQATRLRKALGTNTVVGDRQGYRLALPASWVVIDNV